MPGINLPSGITIHRAEPEINLPSSITISRWGLLYSTRFLTFLLTILLVLVPSTVNYCRVEPEIQIVEENIVQVPPNRQMHSTSQV